MALQNKDNFFRTFFQWLSLLIGREGKHRIGRKLLLYVLLASSVFVLIQTVIQLRSDYNTGYSSIEKKFDQILLSYNDSLAISIWEINHAQVGSIVSGIKKLPDIAKVVVAEVDDFSEEGIILAQAGESSLDKAVTKSVPITLTRIRQKQIIGKLTVSISLEKLYSDLYGEFLFILIFQTIKTFMMSGFILAIFYFLMTRHLLEMADFAKNINLDNLESQLVLKRKEPDRNDELSDMVNALNETKVSLKKVIDFNESSLQMQAELEKQTEKEHLQKIYNEEIEQKNQELALQNSTLESMILELKEAQDQLVNSEKLAALGGMVKGVAHELNTPIGLSITGVSHIHYDGQRMLDALKDGTMTKSELEDFLETTVKLTKSSSISLEKAASLIRSFKMVSVEQHDEQLSTFNVHDNLADILFSINPTLKNTNIRIHNEIPEGIQIHNFPGVFYQIYTNLINNAVLHGFEERDNGNISISACYQNKVLQVTFKDDGCGMDDDTLKQLFDPFFTTKRARGGTGLGMNIIYNLITEKLNGTIAVDSQVGIGTTVTIDIPSILDSKKRAEEKLGRQENSV